MKKSDLTPKEKILVGEIVKGKSKRQAGLTAGAKTPQAASMYSNRMLKKVKIQRAISEALANAELTPDHAIKELKVVVDQNKEYASKHNAIKTVLELHGYKSAAQNQIQLNVDKGFFKVSR